MECARKPPPRFRAVRNRKELFGSASGLYPGRNRKEEYTVTFKEYLPWFSPDESNEAAELLTDIEELLSDIATYGPIRKEIRVRLSDRARACKEFLAKANHPVIERAVMSSIEDLATKKKTTTAKVLTDAIETFVSNLNRSA